MTSNSSSNENSCQNCASLRALLEQKETIVTKYQKIVQSQNELLHDLTQKNNSGGSSTHKKINYHGSRRITSSPCSSNGDTIKNKHYGKQVQINNFRAFVGSVTEDIDEESLRKSLEEAFGEVENIDIIPTKNCAFVDFSPISYHQAVSIGAVMVNGVTLSVERVRRHKSRK